MHSHRQKLPLNLMSDVSSVRSAITCTVQSVSKLSNLEAARSEDVELKRDAEVEDEAFKSSASTCRTEGISRNQ